MLKAPRGLFDFSAPGYCHHCSLLVTNQHRFAKSELRPELASILTLAMWGDRDGAKMLGGERKGPPWSTSSSVSVFIKVGMEVPDVI